MDATYAESVPPECWYPEQEMTILDEFHESNNAASQPPAKKIKLNEDVPEVSTSSYDTIHPVSPGLDTQPRTPPLWSTTEQLPGEDIPPTKRTRDEQKQRIIRRWNLDRTTKVIVGPEGIRFLSASVFTLSAKEWRTWCTEWRSDSQDLILSQYREDKCTLRSSDYGVELEREKGLVTSKFQLSSDQVSVLERRASYISKHLLVLLDNSVAIFVMKNVIASRMKDFASKLNLVKQNQMFMNDTFEEVLVNCVSLGIASEVLADFNTKMNLHGFNCTLDPFSMFFYCAFQITDIKNLLM